MANIKGYTAFDLETTGLFKSNIDDSSAPQITCAVTCRMIRKQPGVFDTARPLRWTEDDTFASPATMTIETVVRLVDHLYCEMQLGYPPITWNGLAYDFRVLAAQAEYVEECTQQIKELALSGVDPMFNFTTHQGYWVSMASVADGFELPVNKNSTGAEAVRLWLEGSSEDRKGVVDYCQNDVLVLSKIVAKIDATGCIRRIVKKTGKVGEWRPPTKGAALAASSVTAQLPDPDNSWMTAGPRPQKSDHTSWIDRLVVDSSKRKRSHAMGDCTPTARDERDPTHSYDTNAGGPIAPRAATPQ